MVKSRTFSLVAIACLATTAVASAQDLASSGRRALTVYRHHASRVEFRSIASPLDIPVGGGVYFRTPFQLVAAFNRPLLVRIPHYQGPDGSYDEASDFVRSLNGTPCGQECSARSLARWHYALVE